MLNRTVFGKEKPLDLICLGRAGVDLYANQIGSRLEDVTSFNKYLGGSSANIAFGTARLGVKSSMLSRVGDEHMGRFLKESLAREGCDVSRLKTDPERLTALVVLGIKNKETFPLIFYRENCADMAVQESDFDEGYVASAKALLITGTHFSTPSTRQTSLKALEYARGNDTRTVLDIDYRPVLWGLAGKGEGENRFVASKGVTEHLQEVIGHFDLVVGTEEEFRIAGGSESVVECLKTLRRQCSGVFVVKRGPLGCSVFDDAIPDDLDRGFTVKGLRVEVLNVLGAGDAFMSGFLKGWLAGEDYERCCLYANACGALVVSRHACSPSMPSLVEFRDYLARMERVSRPDKDERLSVLHRKTVPGKKWSELCVFAFDHRSQIVEALAKANRDDSEAPAIKALMAQAFRRVVAENATDVSFGVLVDDVYGQDVLNDLTGEGFWIARPVEEPSSRPVVFQGKPSVGSLLISWPREHVVKCLVFYHPDDEPEMLERQTEAVWKLYQDCRVSGHRLLLEIIPPASLPRREDTVPRALAKLYETGVKPDWWKLENMQIESWRETEALINRHDEHCNGVVILGLDAPVESFEKGFAGLKEIEIVKGFAVGRTIFGEPLRNYLETDDVEFFVASMAENFSRLVRFWKRR